MLSLTTKADLQRLVDDEIPESLTLDYKQSLALAKDSPSRDELCKDVSAFANSAGGQIVYGIPERDHKPQPLDSGVPNDRITREWIEQVIDSRVQPRIQGLVIMPIPFDADHTGYVITIPQASARAPHQAPDKKYYKRQNFQSVPMEDYEIRDALRRATTPDLAVALSLSSERLPLEFERGREISKPVTLHSSVLNRSNQPAFHVVVQVGIEANLDVSDPAYFDRREVRIDEQGLKFRWLECRISSPPRLPLFKEADPWHGRFTFAVPAREATSAEFYLISIVQTPGFQERRCWELRARAGYLTLRGPFAKFPGSN